jgi:hypothetical protein
MSLRERVLNRRFDIPHNAAGVRRRRMNIDVSDVHFI